MLRFSEENAIVTTYNVNDAFSMDKELFHALGSLDGDKTLEENLRRLEEEDGIVLAPELLQYLFTHGVVVSTDEAKRLVAANSPANAPGPEAPPAPAKPAWRKTKKALRRARR
jgi:hypothetical protein